MRFHIYALLTIFILCSADFGRLRERRGVLECPSTPHKYIFTSTTHGNWQLRRDDPTYANEIFKHKSREFFRRLPAGPNVIVTLNPSETDYAIRDINDPVAVEYALSIGISLTKFGQNMLFHETQGADLKCTLHSLNNLFQKKWIDPQLTLDISRLNFSHTHQFIHPFMQHELKDTPFPLGYTNDVMRGAIHHRGLAVDIVDENAFAASGAGGPDAFAYHDDPTDTIFGIILNYRKKKFGHAMAIRRMGGIWWDLNSFGAFGIKGYRGVKPCGDTGNWPECRDFIHAKLLQTELWESHRGDALIARCPTSDDLQGPVTDRMKNGIMPNLALWTEYCPIATLRNEVCFGDISYLRQAPRYADVVETCPHCTEALCQGIRDVMYIGARVGPYHCRRDNHECELWKQYRVGTFGVCDTSNNQCPDFLPDCIDEPNWEGTLGKCSCGTHVGACNNFEDLFLDPRICLLSIPHQCAPCTNGEDGATNEAKDNCIGGKVCKIDVTIIDNRECVDRSAASGYIYYNEYEHQFDDVNHDEYKHEFDHVYGISLYWFLALDILLMIIGIGCLVMFILFIGGCFVLYNWKRSKDEIF